MNWQEILIAVLSVVVTTIIGIAAGWFKSWLNSKIKSDKAKELLNGALDIVESSVKSTFQTYVEGLKGKDMFNEEAQLNALNMAKETAINQLNTEAKDYIVKSFGDLDSWLTTNIEAAIYNSKNENKK